MAQKHIYLDYAAATPVDPRVKRAMEPYFSNRFYNPSATYLLARQVAQDISTARSTVAQLLGARQSEIIFTAGGTEANNLAIHGVMRAYPGANIVTSTVEHESILKPAGQYDHKPCQVHDDGRLDVTSLEKQIDDQTVLVSIIYANNEIGTIQPLAEVGKLLMKIRRERQQSGNQLPLYFHTDACQATAYLDMQVHRLGIDLLTINGGKIYGPKQSGALYVKTGTVVQPQILGGGQEFGLRSGTENVAAIIGLATSMKLVRERQGAEIERLRVLEKLFMDEIKQKLPRAIVNGSITSRLPNNIHVSLPGHDNERLMMELDERGIMCAVGSACSASSEEPSHVLKAIGLSDTMAQASLRFSMGRDTTAQAVRLTVANLASITGRH